MLLTYLFLVLFGCTNKKEVVIPKVNRKIVLITAAQPLNNNLALSIDIVQVGDPMLWEMLSQNVSTAEYYSRKAQIEKKNVNIWTIHVLDNFILEGFELCDYNPGYFGTILFANYLGNKSDNITKVTLKKGFDCTKIRFGPESITEAQSIDSDVQSQVTQVKTSQHI